MVFLSYFDKDNTIQYNSPINTGRNPIAELYYGGESGSTQFSRHLFHFDETRLRELYSGGSMADLTKMTHTLRMTNTGCFDTDLLGTTTCGGKQRTCSFDLIVFEINQDWDEGVGYDYGNCTPLMGDISTSNCPSNWSVSETGISWTGGSGVYTATSNTVKIAEQHFDVGNENIAIDITTYVNAVITGKTNYGLGIAYSSSFENMSTFELQYVGFFTRDTQTYYEPYIETIYDCPIRDDRNEFYMDKSNKLYLYSNLRGVPTNLDSKPSVTIQDPYGTVVSAFTSTAVTHVTTGVYCIEFNIPSGPYSDCSMFNDIWSDITINGISRPDVTLEFILRDSIGYYNIGDSAGLPKPTGISLGGLNRGEKIKRGDIRRVSVSARIPYTIEQTQVIDGMKYRMYVKEGPNEYTMIDYQDIDMAANINYFTMYTESFIPNKYYIDVQVVSNLETTTFKEVVYFEIVNQVELRNR